MSLKIEDYALIGDCETAALVGRDGSIDWLCWPRFDSDACFAALLGGPENGRWLLAPADADARATRHYREDSLILETDFVTADGAVTVIDFMPLRDGQSKLVRLVVGKRGTVAMRTELILRFDYGTVVPWVTRMEDGGLRAIAGPDMVMLHGPVMLRGKGLTSAAHFSVSEGQTTPFVLTYSASHLPTPPDRDFHGALSKTEQFWRGWSARCVDAGEWSSALRRSLITLKALTYLPTGGIVAAPTTSLPERIGGRRNWDYRFCWLRDATLTLLALMNGGFYDEAKRWNRWLLRAIAGTPDKMQIMYGLSGERRLPEWEVESLAGYEGSRPVRVGNAASEQLQLDVYGEVMDALYQACVGGLDGDEASWALQCALLEHLERIWQRPDAGIWEVRGENRHFTSSKVMAWVAFDRGIRSCEEFGLEGPRDHWSSVRSKIHEEVCREGFNQEIGAFTQSYGSALLDASQLLIPLVGFLPPDDPRVRSTIAAIEGNLTKDGLVLRYDSKAGRDGLPPGEGVFLACSFWLADCMTLLGRHDDARRLFQRLLDLRNDVGLLSEEYDVEAAHMVGNFPQAFSHISLVVTACNLAHHAKPMEQRSGRKRKQ